MENEGKILLLRRKSHEPKDPWCYELPKGNLEGEETKEEAILREIEEETGIKVSEADLQDFKRYGFDGFECWACRCILSDKPEVKMYAHDDFKWLEPSEAIKLKLILGLKEVLRDYYNC